MVYANDGLVHRKALLMIVRLGYSKSKKSSYGLRLSIFYQSYHQIFLEIEINGYDVLKEKHTRCE